MEIERKFVPAVLPEDLHLYESLEIQQAYLCTAPVVRIRRQNNDYYLTYKSKGLLAHEEYNLPLTPESFSHLLEKADGLVITKTRYLIPLASGLTVELDIFHQDLDSLILAEVEFDTKEEAESFVPPAWLGTDVTYDRRYHNSEMTKPGYRIPAL